LQFIPSSSLAHARRANTAKCCPLAADEITALPDSKTFFVLATGGLPKIKQPPTVVINENVKPQETLMGPLASDEVFSVSDLRSEEEKNNK
jgi:hypothetical protein